MATARVAPASASATLMAGLAITPFMLPPLARRAGPPITLGVGFRPNSFSRPLGQTCQLHQVALESALSDSLPWMGTEIRTELPAFE